MQAIEFNLISHTNIDMKKLLIFFVMVILCTTYAKVGKANELFKSNYKSLSHISKDSNSFAIPDAPTNLIVTPINEGGMIQFTEPANDGGSSITNYEYSTDGGTTWNTPSPAVTSSPLIIGSGLTNCTSYQVKIRAVNASGSGAASVAVNLVPSVSTLFGVGWKQRVTPNNNNWTNVTYGNGLFVAVSSSGTDNGVMTSPDGINWTTRFSAAKNSWLGVTYGNGLFAAVSFDGTGNRAMTSPDGINWTLRTTPADNYWTSITYGNGVFVAVAATGSGNRVMTSSDGIAWISRSSAADNQWTSVTYGNGLFVAVAQTGTGNRVMTSPDGINWTIRTSAADNDWTAVTYGNGLFVAVSNTGLGNRVMTSPDGINWTARNSAEDNYWLSVTYGNGLFVAIANSGTNRSMVSTDGLNWTGRTIALNIALTGVTYGNGLFVAVASSGFGNRVMTSGYDVVADAPALNSVSARDNGIQISFSNTSSLFAPAISNYQYTLDNGNTWTSFSPASFISPLTITGLTNGNSYSIRIRAINEVGASCASSALTVTPAVGTVPDAPTNLVVTPLNTGGMIQFTAPANDGGSSITNYEYSTDGGSTWNTPSSAVTSSPVIISSGLNNCTSYQVKIRAVNASGSGAISNAVTLIPSASTEFSANWSQRFSASNNSWYSVVYGNGLFVAVSINGTGNRVMTSPDGINWTSRASAANNGWTSVTYGNGLFVAVSNTGTGNRVMTSPDGINWTSRVSAADLAWRSVTYGNGLFVAVAQSGIGNRVMTSPDGINWTSRNSALDNSWSSVTYGNGLFVAVSSDGIDRVMVSSDGINWDFVPSSLDYSWSSITYGNGLFVVVAEFGNSGFDYIMTSPDGYNWTSRTPASANQWMSVTYGNGLFVAVSQAGSGNRVMTSQDGITWTSSSTGINHQWISVTYGNGIFVAVSYGGTVNQVMSSGYDATAHAPVILSTTARDNGVQVSFSNTAPVYASIITNYQYSIDNGGTWTSLSPASNVSPLRIAGLTNGTSYSIRIRAINAAGASCASSAVSVTPALGTVPDAPTNLVVTPINSGGMIQFSAPANDGGSSITNYEYSTDGGSTWNTPSPAVTTSPLIISSGLTNCNSYQVKIRAVNTSGGGAASAASILVPSPSTDFATSWSQRVSAADNNWLAITYGNGLFVAVSSTGTGNRVMTSPDGITWTSRTSAANNNWQSVTYGSGLFVAVSSTGTGNRVMTSPDGINWAVRVSAADIQWNGVTYGNGLFVAVGQSGIGFRVMTSPDGINWTSRASAADNQWTSVTYGNGLFVAVSNTGTGNRVMTSPDGINWTSRASAADNQWTSVTYGNGVFVAVAQTGIGNRVMTSPDGINWTSRLSAENILWKSVTYGNGLFVAVSNSGNGNRIMTSPDGTTWTTRTSPADNQWMAVAYGNGQFVAVAQLGTSNRVMTSSYGIVADAPVINAATINQIDATVTFTQSSSALASVITSYEYSTDNGTSWISLSTSSSNRPITVTGITDFTNKIQLRAINRNGNSCPASYTVVGLNLTRYGQKTSTGSEFINRNGAQGISGIRATGESRSYAPLVSSTATVSAIATTTATSGGIVATGRGSSVTARGVCWSTTANPTIANSKTSDGTGTGTFSSTLSGLTSGTTYYVRAYATNSVGTSYGPEVSFTTL